MAFVMLLKCVACSSKRVGIELQDCFVASLILSDVDSLGKTSEVFEYEHGERDISNGRGPLI